MSKRDHGGNLDAAMLRYGGVRRDWLDLSTGINPVPYPIGELSETSWAALPDQNATRDLISVARGFWRVPDAAEIIPAPGASALIARMPSLANLEGAYIPAPTYNEHAAAFEAHHRLLGGSDRSAQVHVYVHPNNPDGRLWPPSDMGGRALTIIDESFCDTMPDRSHIALTAERGNIVLKSFGKFWGLAGLRLGFAIGLRSTLFPQTEDGAGPSLADMLGPWAVSGPALEIGARALADQGWAENTRERLAKDSRRLDRLMQRRGQLVGGTDLFRLYEVEDAQELQDHLARQNIWTRAFPYNARWLRLGLPHPDRWEQLERALA